MYSNWHTYSSFVKSGVRIVACIAGIVTGSVVLFAIGMGLAEIVGIAEELG